MEHQVLVWDNGSPEPLPEGMEEHFPDVEFIRSPVNLGFGKACNAAAARAAHPYFFFVNPDTLVSCDTFSSTLSFMLSRPDAGIVGCRILNGDGTIQWACRRSIPTPMAAIYKTLGLAALFPRSRRFGAYNLTWLDPAEEAEVDAVSGSFFCVSAATYRLVGGFDETFFMYGEDLDICMRVRQAGFKNYYYPGTSIVHFKGQSSRTRALRSYVDFYHAMLIFSRKHRQYGPIPVPVIALGILLAALIGVFSRLLPRWWKMLLDAGVLGASLGLCAAFSGSEFSYALWGLLCAGAGLPLLACGEYSTHRLDSRHLARLLAPGLGLCALAGAFCSDAGPVLAGAALLSLGSLLAWRRAYSWGHYFYRVFSGKRSRALLLGASANTSRWFSRENLLPGHELLGCVTAQDHVPAEHRVHVLGSPEELESIRRRTGCQRVLVVPDDWGFHEPLQAARWLDELKMRTSLLLGAPEAGTFLLVDLNYLK